MTDKEKIRNEIERLHDECRGETGDKKRRKTLRSLIHFIDSLPEDSNSCNNGKNLQESASDELEEMAYKYGNCFTKNFDIASMSFIKGAKWQREQMMKHAVDATKVFSGLGVKEKTGECVPYTEYKPCISDDLCNNCDRVKIIIIKDE